MDRAPAAGNLTNLDFLAQGSAVLLNLIPNDNGVIQMERDAIGPHQHIHIVAVDPLSTTYRSISLAEIKADFLDLRLIGGLNPKQHFTQQKQVSIVPVGKDFVLHDVTTSKFEAYDSLARVYSLYATLNRDPKLVEFSFILNWPKLKLEEKRSLYSKYASHELSFFLFKKDPEFFKTVIAPYLLNKKHPTFIDRFLVEDNLETFLEPWQFAQLNIVERILLAQQLKQEKPIVARHASDLFALLPPNIDNFIRLFETAAKRSSLDTADVYGIDKVVAISESLSLLADSPEAASAPASPEGVRFAAPMGTMLRRNLASATEESMELGKQQSDSQKKLAKRSGGARASKDRKEVEKSAPADGNGDDESMLFGMRGDTSALRNLYRKLEKPMELAENNYHHLTIDQQNANLITVNSFWKDYAQHDPATPFLSRNLAEPTRNFPEMLLALAVLDLPFESPKHESKMDGTQLTLVPAGPIVVFHEEIKSSAAADGNAKILVSQSYYRLGDRTRIENGEQVDKFVTDEFLTHVVYGCQVAVTNPTSTRQKLNVLLQIPLGAISVLNGQATKTAHISLEPYHTQTIEYHFYFPATGEYPHFPVHVAKNETLIVSTPPTALNVVDKPTKIDTGSWDYISQYGSTEDVLAYLDAQNVNALNLDRVAWRMHDAKVFATVVAKLAARHIYNHTLWSYSLKHNVPLFAQSFLQHADQIINECGGQLKSPLLAIDPVMRRTYEHLEYKPLVNARAHSLGKRRQIVNDRFYGQYHQTMKQLSYKKTLDDDDLLTVTYYLLLQDRIEEALSTFEKVVADKVSTKMQYAYCAAYLDFFTGNYKRARAISNTYVNFPVDRWRQTFAAISSQLDEAEGKDVKPVNEDDRNQQQSQLASTEPNFDFVVEAKQIKLDSQNLNSVKINFYEMDVELLFSRNPFVQQFRGQFSSITPNSSINVDLSEEQKANGVASTKLVTKLISLPATLLNKNVLIEITGAGQAKSQAYYSHSLAVQVIENYGQIKVTHQSTGKPVPKAYVKVYAQMSDGNVKFYKDGYTDLRGRFDYSSLNTNDLDSALKFSILVLSEENGALVREATPPKR